MSKDSYRKKAFRRYATEPLHLFVGAVVAAMGVLLGLAAGSLLVGVIALVGLLSVYSFFLSSRASALANRNFFQDWAKENGWQHFKTIAAPGGGLFQIADKQEYGDTFTGVHVNGVSATLFNFYAICESKEKAAKIPFSKKEAKEKTRQEKVPCLVLQADIGLPMRSMILLSRSLGSPLDRSAARLLSLFADRHEIDLASHPLGGEYRLVTDREDRSETIARVLTPAFASALVASPEPPQIISYEGGRLSVLVPWASASADDTEYVPWIIARMEQLLQTIEA